MQIIIDAITKLHFSLYVRGYASCETELTDAQILDYPRVMRTGAREENGFRSFEAQFLMPQDVFPADASLLLKFGDVETVRTLRDASASTRANRQTPLLDKMVDLLPPGAKVIDVGGRDRSLVGGVEAPWEMTRLDIVASPEVDIVADAHEMSRFVDTQYDGAISISVFEHLLMPWKVAAEIAKVLKVGGYAMIHTHQTIGMHDMPWDFYRFSDNAWYGLFNEATGFEIIETRMDDYMQIIPRFYNPESRDDATAERAGGFLASGVIARKIGEPKVTWDVSLADLLKTSYPLNPPAK